MIVRQNHILILGPRVNAAFLIAIALLVAGATATAQGTGELSPQITSNGGEIQQGEFGGVFSTIGEPLAQDSTIASSTDESTWVGFWHVMPADSTMGVYEEWTTAGHGSTAVSAAQPNPFTQEILLLVRLESAGHVTMSVVDVTGRTVQMLIDGRRSPGTSRLRWQPVDVAAGTYLLQLSVDGIPVDVRSIHYVTE